MKTRYFSTLKFIFTRIDCDLRRIEKKITSNNIFFREFASGQIKTRLTRKSQLKADKIKVAQKYLFPIGRVENVVDTFDVFCAPGFERVRRRLHASIWSHLIHYVTGNFRRCMRCRFSSSLFCCIIVP